MADIEALKQALPIEALIGEYVPLRKAGASLKGLCPFHLEKTPSFTVSPERGSFRCFGCGKGGDVVNFYMEIEKVDFREAVSRLARKAGIEVDVERREPVDPDLEEIATLNEAAGLFFQSALLAGPGAAARAYVQRRGLTQPTVERFGLGWAPAGWDKLLRHLQSRGHSVEALERAGLVTRNAESGSVYDKFRDRLIFPIRDAKGRLTGFGGRELDGSQPKYLNSPQTKLFDKGSVLYLLPAAQEAARKGGRIVVVEGYMDALAAHQAGFGDVVASLGTALTDRQLRLLYKAARKVVVALDADAAGRRAVEHTIQLAQQVFDRRRIPQLSGRLTSERAPGRYTAQVDMTLHVAALPAGQDPDEVIAADPERWRALIDSAKPIVEFFFELVAADSGDSAERRQRVSEQLLPVIADIADPLERGHYVDRLASLLDIPESVIVSAIEQQRRRPPERRPVSTEDATPEAVETPVSGRAAAPALVFTAERGRQRYVLSMLLRYPRIIAGYADALATLRPEDDRLAAAWDRVLTQRSAQTIDDVAAALPEDGPVTRGFLDAVLRDTALYPPLDEPRLRLALDDAIALLRAEQLRAKIARGQARLRSIAVEERPAVMAELAALAKEKTALQR